MLHGIGSDKNSMVLAKQWIENDFPGIYVANIEIGNGYYDRYIIENYKLVKNHE